MQVRIPSLFGVVLAAAAPAALAQTPDVMMSQAAPERLSPHVYLVRGFPNVAIVVGDKATLVVDTGLGPKNGAVVASDAAMLAKGAKLYLTTTHYHPEHAAGERGFPAGTVLIRPKAQEAELEANGGVVLDKFRATSPGIAALLDNVQYRKPDVLFDRVYRLDLGGVHVRLMWAGAAHTLGDEEVLVQEDKVLITGDVVQNKTAPSFTAVGVGPKDWLKAVEALAPLRPRLVIPDHSAPGDGVALIAAERGFMQALDGRAHALKAQGVPADAAGLKITAELKAKYPDWQIGDLSDAVARAYAE